jgi:hypothetical protein
MNDPNSPIDLSHPSGATDRYVFRPRKRHTWAKGLIILLFLVGWGIAMFHYARQEQERPADASQIKEKQLDWRQRPGTRFPTSYRHADP